MPRRKAGGNADELTHVQELNLQRILDAVVDPVRRSILHQLYTRDEEISCGNFVLPVARSTATHHFNVLRDSGLIVQFYRGTSHINKLQRAEVNEAFPGLLDALLKSHAATQLDKGDFPTESS